MRILLSLLGLSLSVCPASITFTEDQQLHANALPSPKQLIPADIDGDGDADIVALGSSSSVDAIAWFENVDGLGNLSGPQTVAGTEGNGHLVVFDIDDDGDLDIMAAPRKIGNLAWYENTDGRGTFGESQSIREGRLRNATTFAVADLDGDGDLDPYWCSSSAREIAWLPNLGQGNFDDSQTIDSAAISVSDLNNVDIDNDGDSDLIASFESTEKLGLYRNTGNGHFTPLETVAEGQRFTECLLGDLTGDGRPDVITMAGQEVSLIVQSSSGWQAPALVYKSEIYSGNFSLGDADNDGDLDLVAQLSPDTLLFRNNGNSMLSKESLTDREIIGRHITMADLNGDGMMEYLTASYPGTASVLSTHGISDFSVALDTLNSLKSGDLDGDGDADLVSVAMFSNMIAWHERQDDGSYLLHAIDTSKTTPTKVEVTDLTGDGLPEVLAINEDAAYFYPNLGGSFGHAVDVATSLQGPSSITASDLNTDGLPDLVVTTGLGKRLLWACQTSPGNFAPAKQLYQHHEALTAATAADLNGDGKTDLVIGTAADQQLLWLKANDGHGSFSAPQSINTTTQSPSSIHAQDMDGDGYLDLVSMSLSIRNEGLYWFRNIDGQGTFDGPRTISTSVSRLLYMAVEDLDRDGDFDVVSVSRDKRVSWYENDGLGNFGDQQRVTTSRYTPSGLLVEDLNGDGKPDITTVSDDDTIQTHYQNPTDAGSGSGSSGCSTDDDALDSAIASMGEMTPSSLSYERPTDWEVTAAWQMSEDLHAWQTVEVTETVTALANGLEHVRVALPVHGKDRVFFRMLMIP